MNSTLKPWKAAHASSRHLFQGMPIMALVSMAIAGPQDTAWVELFNGTDFSGLYTYNFNDGKHTYDSSLLGTAMFKPVDKTIKVA